MPRLGSKLSETRGLIELVLTLIEIPFWLILVVVCCLSIDNLLTNFGAIVEYFFETKYGIFGFHFWLSSFGFIHFNKFTLSTTTRFLPLPNVLGVMVLLKKIVNEYLGYFHIISPPGYFLD